MSTVTMTPELTRQMQAKHFLYFLLKHCKIPVDYKDGPLKEWYLTYVNPKNDMCLIEHYAPHKVHRKRMLFKHLKFKPFSITVNNS